MFAKRLFIMLSVLIVVMFPLPAFGLGNATLSQAYSWEQNIDVFIVGGMNSDNLSLKVSNQEAKIVGSGLLADSGIPVRTTILLDISASMPSGMRESVLSYINSLIEKIGENEQYKIVIFGEQLNVLQDFTSDRYNLANAVDKIEFNAQQTMIYDAIYNTIPVIRPIDGSPCYYRTIVITDGVDDTATGVTKEELYLRLQNETYMIDVVAVSAEKQAESNKELSALNRISGGRYAELYAGSDIAALTSSLTVGEMFWIRAEMPEALMDGSTRQIDISDSVNSLQFDTKVPVFDAPIPETPITTEEPPSEPQPTPEPTETPKEQPVQTAESVETPIPLETETSPFGDYTMVIYIGAGILVVIIIAIVVTILAIRGRKKKTPTSAGTDNNESSDFNDKTEVLASGGDINQSIRLRNVDDADQVWNISLSKEIFIGRDASSQVCLPDLTVSRPHCKIYMAGAATIENLSKSNTTQVNGKPLSVPLTLKQGDKIKCGRITLVVESLYISDSRNEGDIGKMSKFINVR